MATHGALVGFAPFARTRPLFQRTGRSVRLGASTASATAPHGLAKTPALTSTLARVCEDQ
jgi:hypothetical protein